MYFVSINIQTIDFFIYDNFFLIFIIILLRHLSRVYWQKFTQYHNTAAERIEEGRYSIYVLIVYFTFCSAFVILFILLSNNIYYDYF